MPNPDNGRLERDSRQFSKFKRGLPGMVRNQLELTLEYVGKMNQLMGKALSHDELEEIAQRSLSLIYTGLTPEERLKETAVPLLRSWGINPGAIDRIQVNGKVVTLTRREYDLLELFAASPEHLVTHGLAEKRFGWKSPGGAFSMNVRRINHKTATLGSDAPIKIVSIRTLGYRADLNPDISTTPSTSSALDLEEYPQLQTPNP